MKVILTRDVKDTGHAYETIEVKDGHALNFLIPKKMAVLATPSSLKATESRRKSEADKRTMSVKLVEERLAALSEERIVIRKKANEKGHLYDAVGVPEISAAAQVPEDAIRLGKPIKELGTFDIPVAFGESFGTFKIVIEGEE